MLPAFEPNAVDVRSLQPGTEVLVETSHSKYRLTVLELGSAKALIQGGQFLDQETEGRIEGATFGGSVIKLGWIESGLLLEMSVLGRKLTTSSVRSIHVDRQRA